MACTHLDHSGGAAGPIGPPTVLGYVPVFSRPFFPLRHWLPIGVCKTYGFRSSKDVFIMTCQFPAACGRRHISTYTHIRQRDRCSTWLELDLILVTFPSLFTAGTMTGFDASGHIAEETKNTSVLGFVTAILFLPCTPDLDTLFAFEASQQIYALALGWGGSIFMTTIAILGLMLLRVSSPSSPSSPLSPDLPATRCGVLPGSGSVRSPPAASMTVIFVFAARSSRVKSRSQVSLVSTGGVPTIAHRTAPAHHDVGGLEIPPWRPLYTSALVHIVPSIGLSFLLRCLCLPILSTLIAEHSHI
ncbi:hypothetical protein B0H19DRAFT_1250349 [Mycena capillaripes]|nr:hypothetical protein B0H19DRAFT_1250349 [Mycena capillaripes]